MVKQRIGSRAQVMHGTAKMTGGGLTKRQLKYNKYGKIVSRKASKAAKKSKNLIKAGYITKKGVFGAVKTGGVNKYYNLDEELSLSGYQPNTIMKTHKMFDSGMSIKDIKHYLRRGTVYKEPLIEPKKNMFYYFNLIESKIKYLVVKFFK